MELLRWGYYGVRTVPSWGLFGGQLSAAMVDLISDPFATTSPLRRAVLIEVYAALTEHPDGPQIDPAINVLWAAQTSGHSWFVRFADWGTVYYRVTFGGKKKPYWEPYLGATVKTLPLPVGYTDPFYPFERLV